VSRETCGPSPRHTTNAGERHTQLRDKWFPSSVAAELQLVAELTWLLRDGHSVVIHCYGGKGRTGTVAAALLLSLRPQYVAPPLTHPPNASAYPTLFDFGV
jgi:hypothetical protein